MNITLIVSAIIIILVVLLINQRRPQVEWRAIIIFNDSLEVTDDWNWFNLDIKNAAEAQGIWVIPANAVIIDVTKIAIGEPDMPFTSLNISDYVSQYHYGYLFVQEGDDIYYQAYGTSTQTLEAASDYFGVRLTK